MKKTLILIMLTWFLYIQDYTVGWKKFEIKQPSIHVCEVPMYVETITGNKMYVSGTYFIMQEKTVKE